MPIEILDRERCNGCGICIACCPQDVLRMDESIGKALIKYPEDCIACWACEYFCPLKCIEVSKERGKEAPAPY